MKMVGKKEHHLWKKRDLVDSGQKALNLVRIVSLICLFVLYWIQYVKAKSACITKNDGNFVPRENKKKQEEKGDNLAYRGHTPVWPGRVSHTANRHALVSGRMGIRNEAIWLCLSRVQTNEHTDLGHTARPHARVPGHVPFEMASHAHVPSRVKTRRYTDLCHTAKPQARVLGRVKLLT
ncbi:hypothetical protein Golob_012688 [Gossypium lobatum]|uniref:Uncharacterized protein n=1 Tax=Gossypium lobatum TaxID=34289 RepID=A0A7J8LM74_9ROSI|nr:hypothetical protein [Gossypium lobatum]